MANLLADLAAALAEGGIETVPDGWKTARQMSDESGYRQAQTQRIIAMSIEAGRLEKRVFRIMAGERVYPVPHYRRVAL
jgi:hypothetical protein